MKITGWLWRWTTLISKRARVCLEDFQLGAVTLSDAELGTVTLRDSQLAVVTLTDGVPAC